jgi:hypothetical protein
MSISWLKLSRIRAVEGTLRLSGVGDMSSNLGTVKRATRNSPTNIPNAMMSGAGSLRLDWYMVRGIILVRDEEKELWRRDQRSGISTVLGHFGTSALECLKDQDIATRVPWCLCDLVPYRPKSLVYLSS